MARALFRRSTSLIPDLQLPKKKSSDQDLCPKCLKLALHRTKVWKRFRGAKEEGSLELPQGSIPTGCTIHDVFPSMPHLASSAERGCRVCGLLRRSILEDQRERRDVWSAAKDKQPIEIALSYRVDAHPGPISFESGLSILSVLECKVSSRSILKKPWPPIVIEFQIATRSDCQMASVLGIPTRYRSEMTLSAENIQMVQSWISECQNGHPMLGPDISGECREGSRRSSSDVGMLPTRLLYVGTSSDSWSDTGDDPRLVIPANEHMPPGSSFKYAALSYCWGTGPLGLTLTTTKATLAGHLASIPMSRLPLTLRDACLVCRSLSINFIWIDALCIIQDDSEDWNREAQRMGHIFQHAEVTLAAVAASSTHEGFLFAPLRQSPLQTLLPVQDPLLDIDDSFRISYLPPIERNRTFDADVEYSAWNSRGWTFQERQLASRIIFFGKRGLHFECRSFRRSEDFPVLIRRDFRWQCLLNSEEREWKPYCQMWTALVEEYSVREFTYCKDKIPAISSLARIFHHRLKRFVEWDGSLGYMAGMWSASLAVDLLWQAQPDTGANKIEGAPSWSWLSVRSPIIGAGSWIEVEMAEAEWTILHTPMEVHRSRRDSVASTLVSAHEPSPSRSILLEGLLGQLKVALPAYILGTCLRSSNCLELAIPTWGADDDEEGRKNFLSPDHPGSIPRIKVFFDTDISTSFVVEIAENRFEWSVYLAQGFYSWSDDVVYGLVLNQISDEEGCADESRRFRRAGVFKISATGGFKLDYQGEVIQKFGFERKEFEIW